MRFMNKILAGTAGIAALATAAPAAAQYYPGYGYRSYGYANTNLAVNQCTAAVQNRLYSRTGLAGILGSLVGAYGTQPRVLSITSVTPRSSVGRVVSRESMTIDVSQRSVSSIAHGTSERSARTRS